MRKILLLGIVFLFLLSSFVSAGFTDDAIAFYPMTTDCSENTQGSDGTPVNSPTFVSSTEGCDFNTEDSEYVNIDNVIGAWINDGGFACVWVNPDSYTKSRAALRFGDGTDGAEQLILLGGNGVSDDFFYGRVFKRAGSLINTVAGTVDHSPSKGWTQYCMNWDSDGHINNFWENGNDRGSDSTNTINFGTPYKGAIGAQPWNGGFINFWDGNIMGVLLGEGALTQSDVNEMYSGGRDYDMFKKEFQITAKDIYTDSAISTFNATITNSTDTFTLTTTNGTIIWEYLEEELVNITIRATNLFNEVFTDYNVTNNLLANFSNLVVTAKDRYDDASIDNFLLTYNETTFSTTNGTLRTNLNTPDLDELVSFTISSDDFFDREYENHNLSSNLNALLWNKVNNLVVFKRADNNDNIEDLNVTLTRPDSSQLDLTTNSNGEIQFDFQEDFSVIQGTYSFLIPETFGFLTPVTFFVDVDEDNENIQETYFLSTTSIFVRVFDRTTFDFLEKPTNLFFLEVFNETTSNGTYIQDNVTLGLGTYTVQALSDGYDTEQIEFIYTGVSQIIIDFYMMNLTDESAGTLFVSVIDDFYRVINDAKVNLLEYDTTTKSYIKVSECKTNSNGECSFTIELNKKTYIITAQKDIDGVSNTATTNLGGEIIKTDNEVRNLVLRPSVTGVSFLSQNILLDVEETFENNISTIFMEYSTIDNTIAEMCVEYFEVKSMNRTSVYVQCVNSSSSYSAVPILLNRSNNYEADVYLKSDQNYVFYTFRYQSDQSLQEILSTNNFISPFILLLWIVIIVFMLMTENVTVFVIAGFFLSWLEWLMFPSVVNATGSVLKTMILIFMYYVSRKKEDF